MAEVTSGRNLTVIVLEQDEADALGALLMWATTDEGGGTKVDDGPIHELIEAMYPTWTDDPDTWDRDNRPSSSWKGAR